jgi:hypothetical protein
MPARSISRQSWIALFSKENDLADALVDLDEMVDRARNNRAAVSVDHLEKATRRFLDNAASVDGGLKRTPSSASSIASSTRVAVASAVAIRR